MRDDRAIRWSVAVVIVAAALAGCASTSGENGEVAADGEPNDASGDDKQETEDDRPEGGHWWGQIQERADGAFEEMEDDLAACLERLGDGRQVREIGLEARRGEYTGAEYQLVQVTAHPGAADEHPCVEELARGYVEAVDSAIWDDFDRYVATFVHRGEGEASGCEESVDDGDCARLEVDWDDSSQQRTGTESGECPAELVAGVEDAIRDQRDCWRGGAFRDRLYEYEEVPIRLRAVMIGDLVVEDGRVAVSVRHNRPWVEKMTTCVADRLEGAELEVDTGEVSSCRAELNNRGITLWFGPSFNYVVD